MGMFGAVRDQNVVRESLSERVNDINQQVELSCENKREANNTADRWQNNFSFLSFSQFVLLVDLLDMHFKYCPEQTKMDRCGLKEVLYKIHNSASKLLYSALVLFTDLTAGILGHLLFRRHFHFLISVLVLFGPVLSLWVSKYSIFGNKNHYLYRQDLEELPNLRTYCGFC